SFGGNQLNISGFVLLGLSSSPEFQGPLFCVFLLMYLLSLLGNILIFFLIFSSSRLFHSPMYFFLSHLSLADLGFSSTTVPKMLHNLVSRSNTISYSGCLTQMYFFVMFGTTDNFLLASMAYDRYVAICHPLHYASIMSYKCCHILASTSWFLSHVQSMLYLSCSDISSVEMLLVTEGTATLLGPLLLILFSYTFIVFKVLKVPSTSGRYKAFSTCSSHLTTVAFFYGTLISTYIRPSSTYSDSRLKVASIFYSVVTPMLNPVIYSLRNREMHGAIRTIQGGKIPLTFKCSLKFH
uniref:Olfactory receptor n=1 Tax=Salvator merianae TaxID=96440 RepID=A0A8D0KLT0_SALMN